MQILFLRDSIKQTLLLCTLTIFSVQFLNAQQNEIIINELFESRTASEVIRSLESKYNIKIYFKEEDLSDEAKNYRFVKEPIETVLSKLNSNLNLRWIQYRGSYFLIGENPDLQKDQLAEEIQRAQLLANNTAKVIKLDGKPTGSNAILLNLKVKDKDNKEEIIGAALSVNGKLKTATDAEGMAVLTLNRGVNKVDIASIGYSPTTIFIEATGQVQYEVLVERESQVLDEVLISGIAGGEAVRETQGGLNRVDIKALERIPTFLGERDVVKAVLLNPGVSSIGEGASGFNVRGGNVDQNLVMQDDAILFNSSHALGFFSTFNADMIKSATLHKGAVHSQYGGRLSSVLDVQTKEGADKLRFKANVNVLSATGTIEGPLMDNVSFIFSGRSTYSDIIFRLFPQSEVKNSNAGFYDLNGKFNIKLGKSLWAVSGYYSNDNFVYNNSFGFDYSTKILQSSLRTIISDKISNKLSVVWSEYNSNQNEFSGLMASIFQTRISYLKGHNKLTLKLGNITSDLGVSTILYDVLPGAFSPATPQSLRVPVSLDLEKGRESALYISSEIPLTKWLEFILGYRLNHFESLGPRRIYKYRDDIISEENLVGFEIQEGTIRTYIQPEPRLSMKLSLGNSAAIKAGYGRSSQFLNQIFNTDVPSPTSQWQMVNHIFRPGVSDNYSAGLFLGSVGQPFEFSVEAYQRKLNNIIDYRDYAELFVNPHIETELLQGQGESKGIEVSLKKHKGVINGFVSYTYSQTIYTIEGINNGRPYFANYDQPHNISVILNYQPIERHTFTANFTFRSGRPTTAPVSSYVNLDGVYVPIYSERNALRIPDTHRLDLSFNFGRTHNKAARLKSSWTFTIYNVYARRNPFSVFYTRSTRDVPTAQANRLAIVGTMFPALSFNLEFE